MSGLTSSRGFVIGALTTLTVVTAIFLSSCETDSSVTVGNTSSKSRMLQEVEKRYKPVPKGQNPKSGEIAAWDFFKFLGDLLDVVIADAEGFAKGAGVGAGVGTVIYGGEEDAADKIKKASIVGGVVYGAAASVKEIVEKTSDSLVVPENSPYDSGTQPNSVDSVGWLHNKAVLFVHNSRVSSPSTPVRTLLRSWAVQQRGYDSVLIDSLLVLSRYNDLLDEVEATTTHAAFIQGMVDDGFSVEAAELDTLYSELAYLESQSYTVDAGIALIHGYKSNVSNLSISLDRKAAFLRLLAVYEYCLVLYNDNEDYW